MKIISRSSRFAVSITFLICVGFVDPPIQAQTFTDQSQLTASPKGLEALIYAVATRPSTIRVNFDNPSGRSVRAVIRDQQGRIFYDELKGGKSFRGYLDLSFLPTGNYSIEMSEQQGIEYAQAFTIEPPSKDRISMGYPPNQESAKLQGEKMLVMKQ